MDDNGAGVLLRSNTLVMVQVHGLPQLHIGNMLDNGDNDHDRHSLS